MLSEISQIKKDKYWTFSIIQLSSVTQSCPTLWDPMNCSMPDLPVHHQLPESTQTHVQWVSDAIQPSHPVSSPSPPALNLSSIRVFSNQSALRIMWPTYWSFNFNISPSDEHPGLISFRMNWLDLLAVEGTLKTLQCGLKNKTNELIQQNRNRLTNTENKPVVTSAERGRGKE